jgi:hypothetical protein
MKQEKQVGQELKHTQRVYECICMFYVCMYVYTDFDSGDHPAESYVFAATCTQGIRRLVAAWPGSDTMCNLMCHV